MFFTPELLSRRDSGFGLLWLAATLGSKSIFKKLPKRSVMTADIAQLCNLIAEPVEPLALRLSSNLMYGVVRVYKVKQEILITDINACAAALKKMVQDMHQHTAAGKDLLLAQPTARPHAVTIQLGPGSGHAPILDALFSGWDDDDGGVHQAVSDGDEEFDPKAKPRRKEKSKLTKEATIETARKDEYILHEHLDLLISGSLERSLEGTLGSGFGEIDLSSSQVDGGFVFEDNFLGMSDGFDLAGGLGDELAKELGWEMNEIEPIAANDASDLDVLARDFEANMNIANTNFDFGIQVEGENAFFASTPRPTPKKTSQKHDKENVQPTPCDNNRASSVASFARAFLSQDYMDGGDEQQALVDEMARNQQDGIFERKRKRGRLLLDARTELTDQELKLARAKYLETQRELRKVIKQKRLEKDASKMIDGLIWGGPQGLNAEPLIQFWRNTFTVQVQARTNATDIRLDQEPPKKRARKQQVQVETRTEENAASSPQNPGTDLMMDQGVDMPFEDIDVEGVRRRSSEEPGHGRQISRASSVARGSQFGIEIEMKDSFGSQKSMFPWDNAGTSSAGGHTFSDQIDITHADIGLRSHSLSRRGSPLPRKSRSSSVLAGISMFSPAAGAHSSRAFGENLGDDGDIRDVEDSQRSEMPLVTLEKNSFNFLEYARMQRQANPNDGLKFSTIVPAVASTRHVAAAAFYHCLVLATKSLVGIEQGEAYGPIVISVN